MLNIKKKTFKQHDNEAISYYRHSVKEILFLENLENNLEVDICVIGGGLTGISTSLNLARKGYKVVLIEARKLGWGASGRNGGQLGVGMRKDQRVIENKLGNYNAKELWKLGIEAVDEVKKNILDYKIDCNLKNGVISAGNYSSDEKNFIKGMIKSSTVRRPLRIIFLILSLMDAQRIFDKEFFS